MFQLGITNIFKLRLTKKILKSSHYKPNIAEYPLDTPTNPTNRSVSSSNNKFIVHFQQFRFA